MASKIKNATNMVLADMITSDTKEMIPDIKIVTIKIVTTQRIVLFRSLFAADGSDLDTGLSPFDVLYYYGLTVTGRINLTA